LESKKIPKLKRWTPKTPKAEALDSISKAEALDSYYSKALNSIFNKSLKNNGLHF
jgi:hypothetical protein